MKVIIRYIITAPVSGSMKVSAEGIKTIKRIFMMNFSSSNGSGFLNVSLKFVIILERVIIRNIFINSLGWMVPRKGILNQHLALFASTPKKRTRIREITPII